MLFRSVNVKCDICGHEKLLSYKQYLKNISVYNKYACCRICCQFKTEQTCIKKYGVNNPSKSEEIKNRIVKTNKERFNVDYTFQSEEVKDKIKKTNLLKYGCEYPHQNEDVKNRTEQTNIKNYGFKTSSENSLIRDKISKSIKETWKNKLLSDYNIISISGDTYELMCESGEHTYFIKKSLLNNRKQFKTTLCTVCNKKYSSSGAQFNILEYIKTIYDGNISINSRKPLDNEYEIDVFLPELNIGVEYNGLYWHSDNFLDKNYHYNKYIKAKEKNIRLIQIWEDEWLSNNDNVKTYLKNIIFKNENNNKSIIKMNNMKPLNLSDYTLTEVVEPSKFYVSSKIRYDYEIDKYDFIVYDAGYSIYEKNHQK